jgi:hypothetical protein
MNSIPDEIIATIAQYLDVISTIRFSRVCWRAYNIVNDSIDRVMIPRRRALDKINAIRYEVYSRELSTDDGFGNYCGIREFRDRIVGSIGRVEFTRGCDPTYGHMSQRGNDDIIIFSDKLRMTGVKADVDSDDTDDSDSDELDIKSYVYCCLTDLYDHNTQTDIIYTTYILDTTGITRTDLIRASFDEIVVDRPRKYNDVYIYAKSPGLVDGELGWFP